ncbi:MAG: phosphotransferase [Brasilonema octagenarum HA4186-MV1]|uniref:phosphotransferase n=1 Tax=Brasilonema TaxID=383614 RepID=UPI00145CCE69|nr:phosphotransferase [Brasilonema sennae]MBW4629863.1 phosphotransferase [Brasilonema octagenarum HA4186-MV1]
MTIHLKFKNLFSYLISVGICKKDDLDDLKVDVNSKSFDWVIDIPQNQEKLFVKQTPDYKSLDHDVRIEKEWKLYNFLQSHKNLDYASSLTPEVLHFDESNSILIYKCPNDSITLQSFYENQEAFPIALAELLGTTLAKLHSQTMSFQECHTFLTELEESKLNYQLPYPDSLSDYLISRIEPESLKKTQAVSWRFLGIFQQSDAVREIVTELVLNHRHCCLTHNNIQFHKIFIPRHWEKLESEIQDTDKSLIKIIDWEACSWGDPACDLGKAILGYFLFWLNSMIVHPAIDIKKSIQLATIPLEVVRPSIVAITKAYINTYPKILEDYPDFLKRVVQFAGLGLIYQLLAEFQLQPEIALSHQGLYFFIATQLLCKPEKFLSI